MHVLSISVSAVFLTIAVTIGRGPGQQFGANAAPAEGLTAYGFLMARAFGQPAEHPVMRSIAFKPDDGVKFREAFEKKHGPRGRDLIDSLGRGSYKADRPKSADVAAVIQDNVVVVGASSKSQTVVNNPSESSQRSKK